MNIAVDRLKELGDLRACVTLQRAILGGRTPSVWDIPPLSSVLQSGGLLLGVRETPHPSAPLQGALVDLVAEFDGHSARHTAFYGVLKGARNQGIGQWMRAAEREICRREGVHLVGWTFDPLCGVEAHIAFNKLGAIATGHRRNLYGVLPDRPNAGLATDRFLIEWWIESPRVVAVSDRGNLPPHYRVGLQDMTVVTHTQVSSGLRVLTGYDENPTSRFVLTEIPVDLDRLRARDLAVVQGWRIQSRDVFEHLFEKGYVGVGFIHEGGRSFHLFEKTDRESVLKEY